MPNALGPFGRLFFFVIAGRSIFLTSVQPKPSEVPTEHVTTLMRNGLRLQGRKGYMNVSFQTMICSYQLDIFQRVEY